MAELRNYFKDWSFMEKLWLIFVCSFMTMMWYFNKETPFMLIMTLTGILNLILGAKGKIAGLYFAIINSLMYAYQCYEIKLFGEVMYNVLYSIPVSGAAIYLWSKHADSSGEIKFKTMTPKLIIGVVVLTLVGTFGYSEVLKSMGGSFAFMDSLTTVVAVIASMLYLLRYSEQWLMWVIVNILSIAMWVMILFSGDTTAILIIAMKSVYLITSTYGYFNWRKIANKHNPETNIVAAEA